MSVNTTGGGNWSSTEGSTCDTMSVALSEMPDLPSTSHSMNHHPQLSVAGSHIIPNTPQPPLSPDHHLVNRKELLEQMGLPAAPTASSQHSRNQASSRYKRVRMLDILYQFPCLIRKISKIAKVYFLFDL